MYAIAIGSGPSTRRNVSGDMVPAPTSTSYGCASTQPRSAQKVWSFSSNSWKVSAFPPTDVVDAVNVDTCMFFDKSL